MTTPDSKPAAHFLWSVHAGMRDGTTRDLGTVEMYSDVYEGVSNADGMRLMRQQRVRDGEHYLFGEHEILAADVDRWYVTLQGATNLAAALPDEHTEPTSEF